MENSKLSFILLLDILESKGYLTPQERISISSIEALTNLLKASSKTPPFDHEWKVFEFGWGKFQQARTKEEKLEVLIEISKYTESETIKKVLEELLALVEQIENRENK